MFQSTRHYSHRALGPSLRALVCVTMSPCHRRSVIHLSEVHPINVGGAWVLLDHSGALVAGNSRRFSNRQGVLIDVMTILSLRLRAWLEDVTGDMHANKLPRRRFHSSRQNRHGRNFSPMLNMVLDDTSPRSHSVQI